MKTHQLVSESDLMNHIEFTPEFTKSEKNTLRRLGFAPLPKSPYLHSSKNGWIEKKERVDYVLKHKDTKLEGLTETNRTLTYYLMGKRPGGYSTYALIESNNFESFVKELKKTLKEN